MSERSKRGERGELGMVKKKKINFALEMTIITNLRTEYGVSM